MNLKMALMVLSMGILLLSSCYEFESIDQPETAAPNSTFEVDVSIVFPSLEDSSYHESHYSILLPSDWISEDSLLFSGTLNGVYHFSPEFSDTMEIQEPAPAGYTWWTYMASETVDTSASEGGTFSFTQSVQTGATTGLFFIDYYLEFPSSNEAANRESKDNPIWIGTDISPIAADIYVNPSGDDDNSGLTVDDPLKTISAALFLIDADSLNKRSIYLADGEYKSSYNGEHFPLYLRDGVSLIGESQSGVVLDAEDQNLVLFLDSVKVDTIRQMTLSGGTCCQFFEEIYHGGYPQFIHYGGGAIYADNSQVHLENMRISDNSNTSGGGVEAYNSSLSMKNVDVVNNTAEENGGGLMLGWQGHARLESVRFADNTANGSGGAVNMYRSYASLADITITENHAAQGGGLYMGYGATADFDTTDRSNIFFNEALEGREIGGTWMDNQLIVVDTFTVMQPTDYHVSQLWKFSFNILNAKVQQVDQDLYVSPQGSNANGGTTSADPLRNISYANSLILPNHTIFLSNGSYSPSITGESFPISLTKDMALVGESEAGVILDAEGQAAGVVSLYRENSTISNLTITGGGCGVIAHLGSNQYLNNVTITGNSNHGIRVESASNITLENVTITENTAVFGAGIASTGTLNMQNVLIARNTATGDSEGAQGGGALTVWNCASTEINHATIVENTAPYGGGILNYGTLLLTNSILRNNSPDQYHASGGNIAADFSYSNIQNGDGDIVGNNSTVNWLAGNINQNPKFCDPWESVYTLAENSPCVGSAQDESDMGAFGVGCTAPVGVEDGLELPDKCALKQNYPNPFNPTTTIQYSLPEAGSVKLIIFDILGQEITTLEQSEKPPGNYAVQWNGLDQAGNHVSTGVYFARMEAGDFSQTIKMLMIK